jgi:hypothetical protein
MKVHKSVSRESRWKGQKLRLLNKSDSTERLKKEQQLRLLKKNNFNGKRTMREP